MTRQAPDGHPAFSAHDHAACTADALRTAESVLAAARARMTPVRRRTLEILLESHAALGAYEVLDRLAADGYGHQPPVAYRALEFLVQHGLAHRVQRLNAFCACLHPGHAHQPAFLICEGCNAVAEADAAGVRAALDEAAAAAAGFSVARASIEALGRCPACTAAAPQ